MKKNVILIVTIALVIALSLTIALAGCKTMEDSSPEGIKAYGELVVATAADFPPFEYIDESNNIVGWDIDIAQELANRLGVPLKINNMDFDSVLAAVSSKKAHIGMAGISYSETRDKTVDFSNGVFNSSQMIIVREDSDITCPADLAGKTVAVQSGTVGELLANMDEEWAYNFDDDGNPIMDQPLLGTPSKVTKLATGALAVQELINGKADAVILDKFPAEQIASQYNKTNTVKVKILESSVFDDEYAFAVAEGNKELQEWINQAFAEMQKDGTMERINAKYFGASA